MSQLTDASSTSSSFPEHGDLDVALARAISAAEDAFDKMSIAEDATKKKLWSNQAQTYLLEAEKLKARLANPVQFSNLPPPKPVTAASSEPQVTRGLPKSEQILLWRASYVNGSKYPPWSGTPNASEFELKSGQPLFSDDAVFSISSSQQKVFSGWKRADTALASPTMIHEKPPDLVQDASTDCSVVASLCAGVARHSRGHAKLTSSVLHPWDSESGYPSISPNGKYVVRLNFNGCFRRVTIDDRLPTSRTERSIHVIDRQNPSLLWPALIEKAYLKVRGGYDFPGSNSATDLWIITGWIPEQVFLQDDNLDLDQLWSTVWEEWSRGNVLMTLGTGKMSTMVEKQVGLAGEHDYAVLDIREIQGQRLLLIKNPWCEGSDWHRVPQRSAPKTATDAVASQSDISCEADEAVQSPRDLLNADLQLSPGTFWMDIDNVVQHFESIYLNWNPGLFKYRQDLHFTWDLADDDHAVSATERQPQFKIAAAQGGPVWLLLCRYLDKTNETTSSSTALDLDGFISLSAHANEGRRVMPLAKAIEKSNIVDSPQILLKLEHCQAGKQYTIVAAEHQLSRKIHTFSICAFSNSELQLDHAAPSYAYAKTLSSSWTRDTAGGNANNITYGNNPQFSISLPQPSRLSVLLQSGRQDLNVHIKLVHGNVKRVRHVRNRDVVADSGDYRRRNCVIESREPLAPSTYTAICSTFEPQQIGSFELVVESDVAVVISAIPRADAGRLTLQSCATFPAGSMKIAAKFTPHRLVSLYASASMSQSERSNPHLRLSIEQGQASQRRIIITSEDDGMSATRPGFTQMEELNLSPDILRYGGLWLVITRICVPERAIRQSVSVELLLDQAEAVELGEWTSVDE